MTAEKLRNEVGITLLDEERVMRATFNAMRSIERDLKMNIVPIMQKIGSADIGIEQCAVIVFHGLRGYGDTRLTLEQVGEAILAVGVSAVMEQVVVFLSIAMEGVTLGKSQPTAA